MKIKLLACSYVLFLFCGAAKGFAEESLPFLAIWRDDDGTFSPSEAPYLRIAIWNDGRILFAKNINKWGHDLFEGRIEKTRVAELKKAIKAAGIFDLKGNCYLVPDAPKDCLMADFGKEQQILYWDEVETPGYGINISPSPQNKKFKQCWKNVNRLALESIPKESKAYTNRFERPSSWILKKPIQSE